MLIGRVREQRWRAQPDPVGPEGLALPPGDEHVVETDDGAELAVTVCPPAPAGNGDDDPTRRPTVVLSHCWTGDRRVWAPVARRLVAMGHRVVLYDQRGHGESTFGADDPVERLPERAAEADDTDDVRRAAELTVGRFGADLAEVLTRVDARDAVVAGHSMGGFSTMAFASGHPEVLRERVRGLVLVSTAAHRLGVGPLTPLVARLMASRLPALVVGRPHLGLVLVRRIVGGRRPCYDHLAVTRDLFLATRPEVTAACLACFAEMDLRAGLAEVEVPTTVMVGSHDTLTPPSLGRAIARALPAARLDVLDGLGHMLPLEAPDAVAAAIAELAGR